VTKAAAGTLALNGANTYTGATSIGNNGGTLSANTLANGGVASSIGASSSVAANLMIGYNATLQFTGATATTNRNYVLTAAQTGSINVVNAATNLTLGGGSTATTGGLTKLGAGTLTLSGANLHTGLTTVAGGTLAYGASNALAAGGVTVTGATFTSAPSPTRSARMLTNGTMPGRLALTGLVCSDEWRHQRDARRCRRLTKWRGHGDADRANATRGHDRHGRHPRRHVAGQRWSRAASARRRMPPQPGAGNGILRYDGASVAIDRSYTLTADDQTINAANAATT
jgi:autotransporter-associated beta strand protein